MDSRNRLTSRPALCHKKARQKKVEKSGWTKSASASAIRILYQWDPTTAGGSLHLRSPGVCKKKKLPASNLFGDHLHFAATLFATCWYVYTTCSGIFCIF